MATGTQTMNATLFERVDIHKSCKALETIVNAFNDYCQAAESLSLVQKKLGKALKEAAGLKATNGIASNALNAVAQLMETLAEIDAKFVKIADRECDDASNEVKKWFKKLAKEEKNHDERITATNARIKQAGQQYERKAKKKDLSAAEEHTRYVNLLSVVGPEMSQEKYNHSLFVSQRHTSTVYSITSSISRTADAEWQRAYECVRRFSPLIGRIGECRAFLEGGWTSDPPLSLPSEPRLGLSSEENQGGEREKLSVPDGGPGEPRSVPSPSTSSVSGHSGQRTPAPAYTPITTQLSQQVVSQVSPSQAPAPADLPTTSYSNTRPPPSSFPTVTERSNADSVRSIESLSSFPAPPDHFPIPSLGQPPSPGLSPLSQTKPPSNSLEADGLNLRSASGNFAQSAQKGSFQEGQMYQVTSGQKSDSLAGRAPMVESPKSMDANLQPPTPVLTEDNGRSPMSSQGEPSTPGDRPPVVSSSSQTISDIGYNDGQKRLEDIAETMRKDIVSPVTQGIAVTTRRTSTSEQINEFGQRPQVEMRKISMERTESVASTSSVVASMRDKLVRGQYQPPSSPREREIPRIASKVSDLASRYTPVNDQPPSPISPRATGRNSPITDRTRASPILERRPPASVVTDSVAEQSLMRSERELLSSVSTPRGQETQGNTGTLEDEITARRRRIQELEELERREQAHALRLRERELEHQAFEIQRERERLQGYGGRPRVNSTTNGVNGVGNLPARPHSQYSYSTTNLPNPNPRGPTATEIPSRPVSQYGELMPPAHSQASASSSSVSIPRPSPDHAPYCGCYACSAAQYSVPSRAQPQDSAAVKSEKPKGWIRRLSMPVGNAFSSDSKSNKGIVYNKGIGVLPDDGALKMKPSFERDATGGISNVRPRKLSFGRR